jgi:hypothetical protein
MWRIVTVALATGVPVSVRTTPLTAEDVDCACAKVGIRTVAARVLVPRRKAAPMERRFDMNDTPEGLSR